MFWSSIIIRELALNLAKVIFILKHYVKLRRYLLCGCVAVQSRILHSMQHTQGDTKERELLKCVVAVK